MSAGLGHDCAGDSLTMPLRADVLPPISILCVDDNAHVADAVRIRLARVGGFEWKGWLPDATNLVERARSDCPTIVLLDVDMPGRDPFDASLELAGTCPDVKIVVFSGHVRRELIDKAVEAGAWGYVSKNDGEDVLVDVLRMVADGQFGLSPEVRAAFG
jgi:DNA-binding NarL/FixJ family response regulator